jgi:hypothetical protein
MALSAIDAPSTRTSKTAATGSLEPIGPRARRFTGWLLEQLVGELECCSKDESLTDLILNTFIDLESAFTGTGSEPEEGTPVDADEELPDGYDDQVSDLPMEVRRLFLRDSLKDRSKDVLEGVLDESDAERLLSALQQALAQPSRWRNPHDDESHAILTAALCELSNRRADGSVGRGDAVSVALTNWLISRLTGPLEVLSGEEAVAQALTEAFPDYSVDTVDPDTVLHGTLEGVEAQRLVGVLRLAVQEPEFTELRSGLQVLLYQLS